MGVLSRILAGTVAFLLPVAVAAQQSDPNRGFYVGVGAGLNYMPDMDVDGAGISDSIDLGAGVAATVTAGYKFGGPRVELEAGYRHNEADSCPVAGCDGRYQTWTLMANALYDFQTGTGLTPYVGVGIGGARTSVKDLDHDYVFAYQGIAGVSYRVTPEIDIYADYRYFGTPDLELESGAGKVDVENSSHTGLVGMRWVFAAPLKTAEPPQVAPPPAPAPPPEPVEAPLPAAAPIVRSYLVFFEFDRSELTPDAERIVETAARNAASADVTRIDVTGHADRAGPVRYNQRLSMRRAEAVREELIRNGIPEEEIAIYAKGESEPLVPTRDGVREAQNRRVEIILQ